MTAARGGPGGVIWGAAGCQNTCRSTDKTSLAQETSPPNPERRHRAGTLKAIPGPAQDPRSTFPAPPRRPPPRAEEPSRRDSTQGSRCGDAVPRKSWDAELFFCFVFFPFLPGRHRGGHTRLAAPGGTPAAGPRSTAAALPPSPSRAGGCRRTAAPPPRTSAPKPSAAPLAAQSRWSLPRSDAWHEAARLYSAGQGCCAQPRGQGFKQTPLSRRFLGRFPGMPRLLTPSQRLQ